MEGTTNEIGEFLGQWITSGDVDMARLALQTLCSRNAILTINRRVLPIPGPRYPTGPALAPISGPPQAAFGPQLTQVERARVVQQLIKDGVPLQSAIELTTTYNSYGSAREAYRRSNFS
jgi:hypothetical protein